LVNQYFWPDMAATAQLLTDLAQDLTAAGWRVTALPGRGSYAPGRQGALPHRECWGGIEIRRLWCTDLGRGSKLRRLLDYGTYFLSSAAYLLFGRSATVVVCLSTPPLIAVLGLLARLRGAKFVYKVEDLYPDVAVALGTLGPRSPISTLLRRVGRAVLSRAHAAVALDGAMARTLQERGARRVEIIPNWADGSAIYPAPEDGSQFRRDHDLGDGFIVLYSGNLGMAHRFDAVTDAARTLAASNPEVLFLFVGAGVRLASVREATRDLGNVRLLPYQPRERLRALYAAADLHLITLRDEVSGLLVPSKYSASLAAGKPVLLVGGRGTDLHDEIGREGLGWVCSHDSRAVATAVREAQSRHRGADSPPSVARRLFERRYSREQATGGWIRLLGDLAQP
jgi:glycosyltransferase involved in cell wall biosynthesis